MAARNGVSHLAKAHGCEVTFEASASEPDSARVKVSQMSAICTTFVVFLAVDRAGVRGVLGGDAARAGNVPAT